MKKFIQYDKLSKRKRREINNMRRQSWGTTNPVTRIIKNAKVYSRIKNKQVDEHELEDQKPS